MTEKKLTAAQKKAEAEAAAQRDVVRLQTERRRLIGAGAVLATVALFVGGYAVGKAATEDSLVASAVVEGTERAPGPFGGPNLPEGFNIPRGPLFGEGHRPGGNFGFDLPPGFDLPNGDFFDRGLGFSFECSSDPSGSTLHCEFVPPDGLDRRPGPPDGRDGPPAAAEDQPGFLGVSVADGSDGVEVVGVFPGSPAEDSGVQPGDIFLAVEGRTIEAVPDLIGIVTDAGAGSSVEVLLDRGGEEITLHVVLTAPPS